MATGKFHKPTSIDWHVRFCLVCNRERMHYKHGCTEHSEWGERERKRVGQRVDVRTVVFDPARAVAEEQLKQDAGRRIIPMDRTLWARAKQRTSGFTDLPMEFSAGLFPDVEPKPFGTVSCTFCGTDVTLGQATTEKRSKLITITEAWKDSDGQIQMREKLSSSSQTVYACPDCIQQVKRPIVARIV